jgi:L-asparaginase
MKILFIQTGGTIDKDYPTTGQAYEFVITEPASARIITKVNPSFDHRTIELVKKDSTDLTHEDKQLIKLTCHNAPEDHIVITHGTDTMSDTAQVLDDLRGKIIVLTGSMRPERFGNTDADFNLGTAVGALSALQPGVYIAMSGQVLPWRQVHKDYDQGKFVQDTVKT